MGRRASLGWSPVLRVAPPLLIAEELKSVLGTRVPPPLHPAHSPSVGEHSPRPFAAPSKVRGRRQSPPPPPGPRVLQHSSQGGAGVSGLWLPPARAPWPSPGTCFPRAECAGVVPTGHTPAQHGNCMTTSPRLSS